MGPIRAAGMGFLLLVAGSGPALEAGCRKKTGPTGADAGRAEDEGLGVLRVSAHAEEFSAREIEAIVTVPVERALGKVVGVRRIRSVTVDGAATVACAFDGGRGRSAVPDKARHAVASLKLPPKVRVAVHSGSGGSREMVEYFLLGDGKSPVELDRVHRTVIETVRAMDGVAGVEWCGGAPEQIHVRLSPARMAALGASLHAVVKGIEAARARAKGVGTGPGALATVSVPLRGKTRLALRDVAVIETGAAAPRCVCVVDGRPSVCGSVRLAGTAGRAQARKVAAALSRLGSELAPRGFRLVAEPPGPVGGRDGRPLVFDIAFPGGTEARDRQRAAVAAAAAIGRIGGVTQTVVRSGRVSSEPPGSLEERTYVRVRLGPAPGGAQAKDLISEIRNVLVGALPGAEVGLPAGSGGALAVQLFGPDLDRLNAIVGRMKTLLASEPGVRAVLALGGQKRPTVDIKVGPDRCSELGITAAQVHRAVAAATHGLFAGTWRSGGRPVGLRLYYGGPAARPDLRSIRVVGTKGRPSPLADLVQLMYEEAPAVILRQDRRRYVAVRVWGPVEGFDDWSARCHGRIRTALRLDPEYSLVWNADVPGL